MIHDDIEMLTVAEFAAFMKIGRSTVYKWIGAGLFRSGEHFIVLPNGPKRFFWGEKLIDALTRESLKDRAAVAVDEPETLKGVRINRGI